MGLIHEDFLNKNTVLLKSGYLLHSQIDHFWKTWAFRKEERERREEAREYFMEDLEASKERGVFLLLLV